MTKYSKIVTFIFFILFCLFNYVADIKCLNRCDYITFTVELFFLYCVVLFIESTFYNKGDK